MTDGKIYIDTRSKINQRLSYKESAELLNESIAKSLQSMAPVFEVMNNISNNINEMLKPVMELIQEQFEIIRKIRESWIKFLKPLLQAIRKLFEELEIVFQHTLRDWVLDSPSFSNTEFDESAPINGPPLENRNYQSEKEVFNLVAFKIFAYLMIATGICLCLSFQFEIMTLVSVFTISNPLAAFIAPLVINFIMWIIPEETTESLKEFIRRFFSLW